ncbi:hypothetical protein [Brevibacterium aurantiacum]|uniref:hypothetical protein n=1 Tax=Brevibacterium aurantiacum TaxID=273384 RepID=UPI001FC9A731|nr:hypothetical protein [Brevibacterium aurantiacum]
MGRGFDPHGAHPRHKARTLAQRIVGKDSGLLAVLCPVEGVAVDLGVQQHLVRALVLDAEFVVFLDVDLGEEGLVAQATVGVVAAGVDVGAVGQQVERVFEVGAGVGVLAVVGVDTAGHLVELSEDAVLLPFEQSERDRVGVVRLEESFLLALQPVAIRGELAQFVGLLGHEPVELVVQHPAERFAVRGRDLNALVVPLDHLLDVLDEDRAAGAVGALGVPAGADEVGVDVAVTVLRVRDHQP